MSPHEAFMDRALAEAAKGLGRTSPNPPVGAVVVKGGTIIGVGHHRRAGGPHAEAEALAAAGEEASGADLYLTLEPCDHEGKTAPCAPAIVRAGIARAFVGAIDPNPKVSGRGIRRLAEAGVEVEVGIRGDACKALIEPWETFIRRGTPFVMGKVASTLDGKIATRGGHSKWITGEEARRRVHELRDAYDAVLVGIGTALADDPLLTCRTPGGRDPLRVVVDARLDLPPTASMLRQGGRTLVACVGPAPGDRAEPLRRAGAEIVECGQGRAGVDLGDLLGQLGSRGVASVLVEGGAGIFGSLLEEDLLDGLLLFYGPKIFGDGPSWTRGPAAEVVEDSLRFEVLRVEQVGGDALVELRPGARRRGKG